MSKIVRNGAPTSTTPGILGQEYYDKETGKSYICTSVNYDPDDEIGEIDGTYVWEESSVASSWNDLGSKFDYIFEPQTLELVLSPFGGMAFVLDKCNIKLTHGKKYTVYWNDEMYICTWDAVRGTMGNAYYWDDIDTGEPFALYLVGEDLYELYPIDENITSVNFSIWGEKVIPVPTEYIPGPEVFDLTSIGEISHENLIDIVPDNDALLVALSKEAHKGVFRMKVDVEFVNAEHPLSPHFPNGAISMTARATANFNVMTDEREPGYILTAVIYSSIVYIQVGLANGELFLRARAVQMPLGA